MFKLDNLGRYLNLADEEFTYFVYTDIKDYIIKQNYNSVLLFPPVNNFRRLLIHKTCENVARECDNIISFSIGQDFLRQTVICFRQQIINKSVLKNGNSDFFEPNSNCDTSLGSRNFRMGVEKHPNTQNIDETEAKGNFTSIGVYQPQELRNSFIDSSNQNITANGTQIKDLLNLRNIEQTVEPQLTNDKPSTTKQRRERRPDRAVYVPRPRRLSSNNSAVITSSSTINSPNEIDERKKTLPSVVKDPSLSLPISLPESIQVKTNRELCSDLENCNRTLSDYSCNSSLNFSNNLCETKSVKIFDNNISANNLSNNTNHLSSQEQQYESAITQSSNQSLNIDSSNIPSQTPKIAEIGKFEMDKKFENEELELRRASQEINRSNRRIIKQTFKDDVLKINDKPIKINEHEAKASEKVLDPETDDWDDIYDENGDCLDPKMMSELTSAVGKVTIEKPKNDYKMYEVKHTISHNEFPHVLEVSNFPVEFKTQDLIMVFGSYKETGFDIKWVDDTHALAIFSSSRIAADALSMSHPFVSLKPLAEATLESRNKARKCASSLQPYRARPETCAALARRLVTGALGVRLKTSREELENERRVLKEAKERKIMAAKLREEMWEG